LLCFSTPTHNLSPLTRLLALACCVPSSIAPGRSSETCSCFVRCFPNCPAIATLTPVPRSMTFSFLRRGSLSSGRQYHGHSIIQDAENRACLRTTQQLSAGAFFASLGQLGNHGVWRLSSGHFLKYTATVTMITNEGAHISALGQKAASVPRRSSKCCAGKQCKTNSGARNVKKLSHRCCSSITMLTTTELFARRPLVTP
jgi:hypothetical protein